MKEEPTPEPKREETATKEEPKQEPAAPPKPAAKPRSSIFSVNEELKRLRSNTATQSEDAASEARRVDPETKSKLTAAKGAIVEFIASTRPRLRPTFEGMQLTGEAIELVVSSSELEVEIRRNETELMGRILQIAKVEGYVELRVEVKEEELKSIKPIKLEDRVAHFKALNPLIAELSDALDLQVDG